MACTDTNVYVNTTTGRPINDQSIPSTLSVLPNVIEKSERTIIVHGLAVRDLQCSELLNCRLNFHHLGFHSRRRRNKDRYPVSEVISVNPEGDSEYPYRNMTWAGKQGFQTPIEPETFRLKDMGVFGNEHTERGLTCETLVISSSP